MSHVLLSLCNVQLRRAPMLALLDLDTSDVSTVILPEALANSQGVTGLALSEAFLFVAVPIVEGAGSDAQPEHSSLFVFDRHDLTLRTRYVFERGIDVHSLWVEGDRLWAVSTGTDELLQLVLDDAEVRSESVVWRPEPDGPRADVHHLNTVARVSGDLLVSGFGPRTGERLRTANDGFVVRVEDGRRLASGIDQPHSLAEVAGALVICESRRMSVRRLDGEKSLRLSGYTRGLCVADDSLLVGVSRGRLGSQGDDITENPGDPGEIAGSCAIVRCRPDSLEVEAVVDTAWLGMEIYDLLPVEGVGRWPVSNRPESDRELLTELWSAFDATSRRMKHALQLSAERKRLLEEARQALGRERDKTRSAAREVAPEQALAKRRRLEAAPDRR